MRAPQPLLFVGWQLFCDFLDQVPKCFRRQAGEGLNDCGMLAQTAFCEHGIPPHSGGWIADGWKISCSPIIVNRLYRSEDWASYAAVVHTAGWDERHRRKRGRAGARQGRLGTQGNRMPAIEKKGQGRVHTITRETPMRTTTGDEWSRQSRPAGAYPQATS